MEFRRVLFRSRAYAMYDGTDARTHQLRFGDMELTGDARPGVIVELRSWADAKGQMRQSLVTRSDLPLDAPVTAPGATWLDRQLVAREPAASHQDRKSVVSGKVSQYV